MEAATPADANAIQKPKRARRRRRVKSRANGEGSHYPEAGRWVAALSYFDGVRFLRKKARFDTEAEAIAARVEWAQQRRRRTIQRDDGLTVASFLRSWLEDHRAEVRVTTWNGYEEIVRMYLVPEMGHIPLTALDPAAVRAFMRRLAQRGKSPSRIGAARRVLRAALTCAKRDRLVDENVAMLVEPPRQPRTPPVLFTAAEVTSILEKARPHRLGVLAALALGTGMRRGEMAGLRWENVDLAGRLARVVEQVQRVKHEREGGAGPAKKRPIVERRGLVVSEPKSDKSRREVPLPSFVLDALRDHERKQKAERLKAGPLWVDSGCVLTTKYGARMDPRNLLRAFYEILDEAGVKRRRLHATRHTTASHLAAQNTPRAVVRDLMGHTDSRTTDLYYTHTVREQLDAAAVVLERLGNATTR